MFYSQTFLGRKGPLGTVWCAAHLQHRLKKSHYTSTDIPKTVDYIMYSEVPIALRMSGHLLLGVVRIYSKKVEYLFKDCNIILTGLSKLFTSSLDLNLPENAQQASVHAVTLPNTFELNELDLDDAHYHEAEDSHLRSQEEITLTDQIPNTVEPFVAITFDEDCFGTSLSAERQNSGVRSIEEELNIGVEANDPPLRDPVPSHQSEAHDGDPQEEAPMRDLDPSHQSEAFDGGPQEGKPDAGVHLDCSTPSVPEIEVMRDADHDLRAGSPFNVPFHLDDLMETEPVMNEKETPPPDAMEVATLRGPSPVDQQRLGQQSSGSDREAPENFDGDNSLGPNLVIGSSPPQMNIRPSPQVEQQPQPRQRKRKQFYDGVVVLTNGFMRKALNDTSDILRKRKPNSSLLDLWKLSKRQRKEQIFDHPLITGMCEDLVAASNKEYVSNKACSIRSAEVPPEALVTEDSTAPFTEECIPDKTVVSSPDGDQALDLEIERLRQHDESGTGPGTFHGFVSSPPRSGPSSSRRSEFTPFSDNDMSLLSEIPQSTAVRSDDQSLPDLGMSTGSFGSDLDTPIPFSEERFGLGENRLSDIQELDTAEEELNFLEVDDASPCGSWGGQGGESLSVRTRAVAQYLKKQSPTASVAEGQSENLSLNKILEGKKRRLCARMFYETLVLKSYELVDVQQEEPYGDISLKLTPTFSKAQL
ncbi:sister chromatid cohesion 1 protein 3 isoform X2 [Punica granatum]|uniref:Sister chromatid cohesion 1 protein 3 isoform X2 n=1 Tax=Punica granatum TaxID=22663 RepID=A0A6P8BMX5_PUNGR|nr:sister chromatid cohesion 1 protein 3 isoform X2 [Punica granatum]